MALHDINRQNGAILIKKHLRRKKIPFTCFLTSLGYNPATFWLEAGAESVLSRVERLLLDLCNGRLG